VVPKNTVKVEPAAEPKQIRRKAATKREVREIPASQFGRVRTLTKYGMTQAQVAELYGVTVDAIERIIRRPYQPRKS
jgi:DNA-binding transcriptional regulator YiaG